MKDSSLAPWIAPFAEEHLRAWDTAAFSQANPSSLPAAFSISVLERNLGALALCQPKLAQRITWPVDGSHVLFSEDGQARYRLNLSTFPLNLSPDDVEESMSQVDKNKDFLLFGIGLGEQVDFVMERFPQRQVLAWDKDPWLLRLFLMGKDLSGPISSGRLRLFLGTDLIRLITSSHRLNVLPHPFLKNVYPNEAELIGRGVGERRVLMNTGGLFVDDVAKAFKDLGYTLFHLNMSGISLEEIEHSIIQFMPQILFSVNYPKGLSELAERFNLRVACWEVDPSIDTLAPLPQKSAKSYIFTYRKKNVEDFLRAGFNHVEFLPLAADPDLRRPVVLAPQEKDTYTSPVSFVGNSLSREAEAYRKAVKEMYSKYCDTFSISADPDEDPFDDILKEQARDFTHHILPGLFHERFPRFEHYFRQRAGGNIDPVRLLSEACAARKRLTYLSRLAGFGVKVWGDEGWKKIEGQGLRYMGPAGHRHELNKIYCGSAINVEINRLYQPDMVSMRIFDVMACGGFVLAEHSEDLEVLFELGKEVVPYRSLDELVEKVQYYHAHQEEAACIAGHGMAAVRARHTVRHRVERMLAVALPRTPAIWTTSPKT